MAFTNEQLERYSRHIILKEVGAKGQKKLLNSSVLIIGAGGLGSPAALYLAAAGVGTIGIADADEVDLSNLQRQVIHATKDIGKAKVLSAKESMEAINPDVTVKTYQIFVDSETIMDLIKDYDFIIEIPYQRCLCYGKETILSRRNPSFPGTAYDLCSGRRSMLQMCIQRSAAKRCRTNL